MTTIIIDPRPNPAKSKSKFVRLDYACRHTFTVKVHSDSGAEQIEQMKRNARRLACPSCDAKGRDAA